MKKKTKIKYVIAAAVPILVLIGLIVLSFDPARDAVPKLLFPLRKSVP